MKVCDCYRQLEPIQLMVGECLGAKNKPRVDCFGDERRCLFYSDRRRKAKSITNGDRIRSMTDEELAKWLDLLVNRAEIYGENKVWLEDTPRYYTDWLGWLKEASEKESAGA